MPRRQRFLYDQNVLAGHAGLPEGGSVSQDRVRRCYASHDGPGRHWTGSGQQTPQTTDQVGSGVLWAVARLLPGGPGHRCVSMSYGRGISVQGIGSSCGVAVGPSAAGCVSRDNRKPALGQLYVLTRMTRGQRSCFEAGVVGREGGREGR